MAQASFAELEHDLKKRRTRRELFLEKMDKLVPWERLERRIEPFYAKAGRGRRPYPLSVMLRVHCVQLFYNRIADYLTMDFPDYFVRRRRGFLTLFGLCRIDDEPVPTHFLLASRGASGSFRPACWGVA